MKFQRVCVLILFLISTFVFYACSSSSKKGETDSSSSKVEQQDLEDTAALVNGVKIHKGELDRAFNVHYQQTSSNGSQLDEEQTKRLKEIILKQLIETELLYQKGQQLNVNPSDEEISARLEQIKKQYQSESQFREELAKKQLTPEDVTKDLKKNYVISKVLQEHMKSSQVDPESLTEEQLKQYYDNHKDQFQEEEKIKASHILAKVDKGADEATRQKAKEKITEILKKVKSGEDFAKLAKENSECPSSANGGDLGFFTRGQMVPEFSQAAFNLKVGEVSDVVESPFGYHIIKVTETSPAREIPYEESKDKIKQYLSGRNKGSAIKDYIQSLREKADIKILIPELVPVSENDPEKK